METTWNIQKDSQQQRTTIHIQVHRRVYQSTRNQVTIIDSVSFSNRWSNKKDKPRDRNIFMTLHELPTGQLDGIVGCSRVSV